jgi:hypothetical protein
VPSAVSKIHRNAADFADFFRGVGSAAKRGSIVIVTAKLDRMFRSAADALATLEELKDHRIGLQNCSASCAMVRPPLIAARATFALKAGVCGSGAVVSSWSLLIRRHQRALCQAEIPLSALSKIPKPPLSVQRVMIDLIVVSEAEPAGAADIFNVTQRARSEDQGSSCNSGLGLATYLLPIVAETIDGNAARAFDNLRS